MEESPKVSKLNAKEISKIDANQIAFYTLTDGTIVRIKKDGENNGENQLLTEQKILAKNQKDLLEKNQEQQINQNDENIILQPGENYGLYVSGEERNNIPPKQYTNTCKCVNAKIIDVEEALYPKNQSGDKIFSPVGVQAYQQTQTNKIHLYKLVTAVPVKLSDITRSKLMNQNQYIQNQQYCTCGLQNNIDQSKGQDKKEEICNCICTCPIENDDVRIKN